MALNSFALNKPVTVSNFQATFMATIDGNRCKTISELFKEISSVFHFPEYFGNNFDALYDCLTDLEWLGVDHIYLLITHPALICSEEDDSQARIAFDELFKDVLDSFQEHPIHFNIIAEPSFLQTVIPTGL